MPAIRKSDVNQFLNRRRDNWRRLEALLEQVEGGGLRSLSTAEVREFGILYRRASSDLVTARAKTANAEILQYLNDLVARAYAQVYRSRRFHPRDILTFLWVDFPRLCRHTLKYSGLAAALLVASVILGWTISRQDPALAYAVLPAHDVKEIPGLQQLWSKKTGHDSQVLLLAPFLSSHIFTHNIAIGYWAFAGGILFGIGPLYAMLENGLMVGILGEAMTRPKTWLTFWSIILPHGIIELTAFCIFGGAGFLLGSAMLAPGNRSRKDALIERGRLAVLLALGATAMLVVAGLIEGFLTPPAFIPRELKLAFAGFTLLAEIAYFGFAGRGPEPGLLKEFLTYEEPPKALPAV